MTTKVTTTTTTTEGAVAYGTEIAAQEFEAAGPVRMMGMEQNSAPKTRGNAMKQNTETVAEYGDDDGVTAVLIRRGGHYYIRTWGEAYTRDAGRPFDQPVSSRAAGLDELKRRRDEAELSVVIMHGPLMGEMACEIWSRGLGEEETRCSPRRA